MPPNRITDDERPLETRLREVVESVDAVAWELDATTFRFGFVGPRVEELTGYPVSRWLEAPDFLSTFIYHGDLDRVLAWRMQISAKSEPSEIEYRIVTADGRTLRVHDTAVRGEGSDGGVIRGLMILTDRNLGGDRDATHHAIMSLLADAETVDSVAEDILQVICKGLDWAAGLWWKVDEGGDENVPAVVRCSALWKTAEVADFEAASRRSTFERGVGLPGHVWEIGRPEWIPDVAKDGTVSRAMAAARAGFHAAFAFPIQSGKRIFGVMQFLSREIREPDDRQILLMGAIGMQLGQLTIRDAVQQRLRTSETRLAFIAKLSEVLAAGMDKSTGIGEIVRMSVPYVADWCSVVQVRADGSIEPLAVIHANPEKVDLARELQDRYPVVPAPVEGLQKVMSSGKPQLYHEMPETLLATIARDAAHLALLRKMGLTSAMIVPLCVRDTVAGAITFAAGESQRRYTEDDLRFAEDIARHAALALDNARLFQESTAAAKTLQQTLLPPILPDIPRVELAAGYHPLGFGAEVGGDFYDIFPARGKDWAVVIGDVCGKGVEAAVITTVARYAARLAVMQEPRPSKVLKVVNDALLRHESGERFCTVAYGRFRPTPDGMRMTLALGGHELPLILRKDGAVEPAGRPGSLLGVLRDPDISDVTTELAPGDAVLFFTDGVTEARAEDSLFGEARLRELLASCVGETAQEIVSRIERAVLGLQKAPRDDVALLVLRVLP